MTFFFSEYFVLLFFTFFAAFLAITILFLSYLIAAHFGYPEKVSPYECGFDPFDDARDQFDIRFYLVAMLFLVFDLEASFLFPWCLALEKINNFGFWVICDFLFELAVGFIYIWRVGALEWS